MKPATDIPKLLDGPQFPVQETDLEILKNICLAAIYQSNDTALQKGIQKIGTVLSNQTILSENDEKTARQILAMVNHLYLKQGIDLPAEADPVLTQIKKRVVQAAKTATDKPVDIQAWLNRSGLTQRHFELVCRTAMTFQLTIGCSHYCRRCNEWALPGVRSHFSFEAICSVLHEMERQHNPEIALYGASDPLDWSDKNKNILDLIKVIKPISLNYSLLSKAPRGKKEILKTLADTGANLSVSVTAKNKQRVEKMAAEISGPLWRQHDSDDLMIPAGLDEDFTTVKPSITDGYGAEITPDGAFIVIPTFTSGLHPFGHKKIPITADTPFFPFKMTGRHGLLVDYFKPLKGFDLEMNPVCLDHLLDVQIETLILDTGEESLTPPGMTSFAEFLDIFQPPAMMRRKSMIPSVFNKLFTEQDQSAATPTLSNGMSVLQLKFQRQLELCRPDYCRDYKLYALSFFFKAIRDYLSANSTKTVILKKLLAPHLAEYDQLPNQSDPADVELNFKNPAIADFPLFRFYVKELLIQQRRPHIDHFIQSFPAGFDPITDVFIHQADIQSGWVAQ